ncbi:O-antigen ligase family protein [Ectothiorhodospiraceae bacterium WFHF3C12]|nr:O-antigen ligase family protein [Ectothiorhodospiraceae bacterium WFHF3C12]
MAERIGLTGLYVLALSALLFPAPANLGLLAMVLATIARGRDFLQWLRQAPAAWLAFGFTAYVLLRGAAEIAVGGLAPAEAWKPITGWALLGMAPIVAYWCGGREDRCRMLFALCLVGMLVQALRSMDAAALDRISSLHREHFGLRLLGAPLYASIALLGLAIFRRRIFWWIGQFRARSWRFAIYVTLVLVFAYLLLMFILPQSRSSWVAALIAFPVAGFGLLLSHRNRSRRQILSRIAIATAAVLLIGAALAPFLGHMVVKRIGSESATWEAIMEGRWEEAPYTSIGRRVHMTANGISWFAEDPVFGIGPGGVESRLKALDQLSIHEDLHNSYLDLAVEMGLVGAMLLLGFLLWSYWTLLRTFAVGCVSADMFWFLTGSLVIYLLVATMNTRLVNVDGQFSWLLLTGIVLSLSQWGDRNRIADSQEELAAFTHSR